jgi:hypothetical protein
VFGWVANENAADSGIAMNAATMMPDRYPHRTVLLPRSSFSAIVVAGRRLLLVAMSMTLAMPTRPQWLRFVLRG